MQTGARKYKRCLVSRYIQSGKASKVVYTICSMSHDWCSIELSIQTIHHMHALRSRLENGRLDSEVFQKNFGMLPGPSLER